MQRPTSEPWLLVGSHLWEMWATTCHLGESRLTISHLESNGGKWFQRRILKREAEKRGHYLSKGDHLRKTDNRKSHKQLAQMVSLTEDRGSEGETLSCRDFQATCRQESESALSSDSTVMPLMGLQMRWCDWFAAEKGHCGSNQEAEGLK